MTQKEFINKVNEARLDTNLLSDEYWATYSDPTTWQFWYLIALLIIPLVALYVLLNRKRFFEILFYGYTLHVLFTYFDAYMSRYGFWEHPYMILPQYPFTLSINASLLPVAYLLLYQFCTQQGRNFHIWLIGASALIGIGFVEIHRQMGVFILYEKINILQLHEGLLNFYMFIGNYIMGSISYWFTKLFLYFKHHTQAKI
ncbi:hypothetical protein [Halalkalibacter okhensis]|uniref:hypothetical protein n=1 Tax=Halalkalibacter okhensis TaxID=333138 RepID=UPI00068A7A6C|nr:hypothetical protein [Halalkalibacter okhensis]